MQDPNRNVGGRIFDDYECINGFTLDVQLLARSSFDIRRFVFVNVSFEDSSVYSGNSDLNSLPPFPGFDKK